MARLDSLLDGADAAAHLVACGLAAVQPLRDFLLEGRPRGVYQPRLWAVQALNGLGADDVLIEYLLRPIASDDAVVKFAEQTVRSAAAKALAESNRADATSVLFEIAWHERLPGALEALAIRDPEMAAPILVNALADDFARDAAQTALRRLGGSVKQALVDASLDAGNRPESTLRRRIAALGLVREVGVHSSDWRQLERLLHDPDARIVCAVSMIGVELSRNPGHIARRLLEMLPQIEWDWLSTVEDMVVRCAQRAGDGFRPPLSLEPSGTSRADVILTWRRICRRLRNANG